jgi:sterol desaturase/sphingolipid hydroxylase (fatty acid hydroxylase superfamily)
MQTVISYFNSAPDFHRIILLSLSFFILWNLEKFMNLKNEPNRLKHLKLNATFMLTAAPVQLFMGIMMNFTLRWTNTHHFGIFNQYNIKNPLLLFISTFIFLDFCEYAYHVLMHKVKSLWRFHLVHHADTKLDVSTTLREHPVETAIRLLFTMLWVFIGGVSLWTLIFRQFIQIVSNVIAHANFRIPEKLDKILSLVVVTPNFHHVHHHYLQPYTDKNYGDVLSIWDRGFGTFARLSKGNVVFGVDTHSQENKINTFGKLLKLPLLQIKKMQTDKRIYSNEQKDLIDV